MKKYINKFNNIVCFDYFIEKATTFFIYEILIRRQVIDFIIV